jgi:hypothetical protein
MTGPVPVLWPGATVAILAGGASLRTQDLSALDRCRVKIITVNDSWRLLTAHMIETSRTNKLIKEDAVGSCAAYFCDAKWWQASIAANRRTNDKVYSFHDAIYRLWWFSGSPDFINHPQVHALRLTGQRGHEPETDALRHGSNSGYQAVELAVKLGAKRIVLLGYDMRVEPGGRSHWHDEPRASDFADVAARSMLPHFATLVEPLAKLGVEVVNATPGSALECWPKMSLEDALA